METVTKNGVTYTPTSDDAALTYDSSGNVTGISKGTVEVTLENSTDPKITLDGSTAFSFTAESTDGTLRIVKDSHSFNYVSGKATYSADKINFPAGNVGVKLNNAIFSSILGTITVTVPSGGLDVPFNSSGATVFNLTDTLTATVSGGTASGSISLSGSITYNAENKAITLAKDAAVSVNNLKLTEYSTALNFGITANSDSTLAIDGLYFVFKDGASVNISGSTFGLSGDVTLSGGDLSFGLLYLLTGQISEFTLSAGTTLTTTIQGLSVNISATNDATTSISMANNVVSLTTSDDNGVNVSIGSLAAIPINIKGTVKIDIANHAITFTKNTVAKVTLPSGTVAQITANDDATSKFEIASDGTITLTPNEGDGTLNFKLLKSKSSSKRLLAASSDDSDYETTLDADIEVVSGSISFNLSTFHLDVAAGTVTKLTMGDYVFTTSNSKNAGGTISFTDEGGITYTPDSDDGGLTITVEGTGDSQFENVALEALSGSFTLNPDSTISIAKDTELKLTFSDTYSISFKTTNDTGGTLALLDGGITFTPAEEDGHLELTVTNGDTTRTASLEMTGTVTYTFDGNIELAEGTVVKNVFENGNELTITANTDASGTITFNPEGGLTITPSSSDALNVVLTDGEIEIFNITSIKGSISYQGGTVTASDGSEIRFTNYFFDENEMIMSTNGGESSIKFGAGGTSYIASENAQFVLDCQDGETLELQNGTFIDNYGNTATITAGSIFKTNDFDPIYILETAGTYTLNGNEITTTADNVEVYLPNGDTVSFDAGAGVTFDGKEFSGEGTVSITNGEISFVMTEAGEISYGDKTFELTEDVESGVTVTLTDSGFEVSHVVTAEEVAYYETDESEIGKTFVENVSVSGDKDYTVTLTSFGVKELQNISKGVTVTASAELDGETYEDGTNFDIVTDSTGKFTFGDKTYTISDDDSVRLRVFFANDGTAFLGAIGDLSDEGNIQIGDSILSSGVVINSAKAVQIIGTDEDDTITSTGHNVTIYGNAGNDLITASGRNLSIDAGEGNDSLVAANSSVSISNSTINLGEGEDVVDFAGILNQVTITGAGATNDINIGTLRSPIKNSSRTFNTINLTNEDAANISIDKMHGAGLMLYLNNTSGEGSNNVSVGSFEGNKNIFFESVSGAVANNVVLGDINGKNNFVAIEFGPGNANFGSNNDSITIGDIAASNGFHMWLDGGNDNVTIGEVGKKVNIGAVAINSLTAEVGDISNGGHITFLGGNAENNITTGNLGASVSFYAELQDGNDNVKIGDVGKKSNVTVDGGGGADTFEFNDIYGNVTVTSGEPKHINRVDTLRNPGITAESIESTAETNAIDLTISTVKAGSNVEITGGEDADKVSIGFVELGSVSISLGAGNDSIYINAVSDSISSNESKVSVDAGEGDNYIKLDFGYKNTITSGNGNDLVEVTRGSNMNISTGAGNDTILGVLSPAAGEDNWTFGSNAIIDGGAGNDYISPHYSDNSSIYGGAGNDTIINNGENTTINGGAGNDYIELTNNLRANTGDYEGQVIEVSAGNDTLLGVNENTSIVGTFTNSSVDGDNVILTSAEGTLTIIDGKGETFYINGAETTIDENMTALNINNSVANTLIEGTELNDTISNTGDNVTIDSGSGNDSISVIADNVSINTGDGNNTVYGVESKQINITTGDGDNYIYNTYVKYDEEKQAYVNYDSDTASTIITGAGNDTIANEGMYQSSVDAGEGDNVIGLYHSYENTVTTGAGDDSVIVGRGHKLSLSTGAGNDTIQGTLANVETSDWTFGGYNTVDAGKGNDYIDTWYSDNSSIYGGAGNDTIIHNGKNTTINGGAGNDYIEFTNKLKEDTGDYESAIFVTSLGHDTIKNYSSVVTLQGTFKNSSVSGNDVVLKTSHGTLTILDGAGETLNLNGVESVVGEKIAAQNIINHTANTLISGSSLDDTVKNSGANVTIQGYSGNDSIKNSGANALIYGDEGNDKISLSSAAKNNTIYAGEGDDSIIGSGGNNLFVYEGGNDYISAYKTTDTIQIESGEISNATLSGSNVIFTVGENNITLKGAKNRTINLIDADGNSFSTLIGGTSTEATITDSDQSIIKADRNALVIDASDRTEDLQITGNSKANTIYGGSGNDTIDGGAGSDSILGNDGADKISGGAGNDSMYGGAGADYLEGNSGKDYLEGGAGNDTLDGGAAADTLTGGAGHDLFVYSAGKDVITDYTAGADKIQISKGKISDTSYDGDDVIFKIGTGSLTVQNGNGKDITIIDSSGNETTETYSDQIHWGSRTLDLLYDNNFMTDDTALDDITEAKYSVTDIQDNKVEKLAQDSTILTYGEDK